MNTKHTPGPWEVDTAQTGNQSAICPNYGDHYGAAIAHVYTREFVLKRSLKRGVIDNPKGQANAHLIAAAPDLLENLRSLAYGLSVDPDDYPDGQLYDITMHGIKSAKNAIAKAEGRS